MRAEALAGRTVGEVAAALAFPLAEAAVRRKGRVGELAERALGGSAGSTAEPDFPSLGVELKTIPLDARGAPLESTFVTAIALREADQARWAGSRVQRKLAHVLWLPVEGDSAVPVAERHFGRPLFWRPSAGQEAVLAADFEDLMGELGAGGVERLTAHRGRWLQVRPKAATGSVRRAASDGEGGLVATVPRGFYLRARFTAAILRDPLALP